MLSVGRANARIGVCIPREPHTFYGQIRDGILEEERRYGPLGVEVLYCPVDRLGVREAQRLKEVMAKDVQGLILTPGDPTHLKPLIDEAEQKNIRVICVASDAPSSARSSVVCVEPAVSGRLAAELMSWLVPSGSEVAVVTGMLHTEDHLKKTEGFSDAFPGYCPGSKVVEVVEGFLDSDVTFQKCLALLKKFPSLAGIYVNVGHSIPVCYALNARQLAGKVRLIGTDLFREMVPFLEKGTISACIYQRPYVQGQWALRLLVDHVFGGRPIPSSHYLSPNIVMRSNLYHFREMRQPRDAELSPVTTRLAWPGHALASR